MYSMTCLLCKDVGTTTKYVGETSRSAYVRCREHWALLRRRSQRSVLHKHQEDHHPRLEPKFSCKVETTFPDDTLGRQINEAVSIWHGEALGVSMNDRTEWNHPGLPRAALERQ